MIKILSWKLLLAVFASLILALFIAGFFIFRNAVNRPEGRVGENILIEIKQDESVKKIASDLASLGLVRDSRVFHIAALIYGKEMKPGFYEITPEMSIREMISKFNTADIKLVRVTFPEGWRTEQIAQRLAENHIISYSDFMASAKGNEGKLFPDTYFFNPRMTADEIIKMMLDNYSERTAGLAVDEEDLIIASIVEREASKDEERGVIAGVYTNRLNREMKLEADPTVQYGRDNNALVGLSESDLSTFKYWRGITISDYLNIQSPFNTYLIPDLPPAPICNPGLKSIQAALNPEKHDYLYFLQKDGQIYPSATSSEHDYYRATVLGASIKR